MKFHVFIYLSNRASRQQLNQLVSRFGTTPTYRGYLDYIKSPEQFKQAVDQGIYASLFDDRSELTLPLATGLQDDNPKTYHLRFTLAVDAIFSPELQHLQGLPKRTSTQDHLLTALERGQTTFGGPAGFSMAKAGQAQIAKAGYTLATIEGTLLLNDHPVGLELAELEVLRRKQRDVIIKMLDTVTPEYAFIAQQNNYELWHMGPIDYFPPLEPWHYLWSFMTYGKKMVEQLGRDFLEAAPAVDIFASETGLIHMQPFDFTFHTHEHGIKLPVIHAQQIIALCEYLGVELPYETWLGSRIIDSAARN